MGNYEEAYRKYYLDTKEKYNIKTDKKKSLNEIKLDEKDEFLSDETSDIYPNTNYDYLERNIYEGREMKNMGEEYRGTYKGISTYSGINNYNNLNAYSGRDDYRNRQFYGYGGVNSLNNKGEEKTLLGKWGNRIIFELIFTFVLFVSVAAMKSLPYEQTKNAYAICKEAISKDFDYKNFIEDVKSINVKEELDKLKVNLNIDESIKTKADDVIDSKTNNSSNEQGTSEKSEDIAGDNIN